MRKGEKSYNIVLHNAYDIALHDVLNCSWTEDQKERIDRALRLAVEFGTACGREEVKAARINLTRDIPNTDEIGAFFHCGQCLAERPEELSPREWARLNVGWTKLGLQVWCIRHDVNVIHVDFEEREHWANVTVKSQLL